MCGISGVFRKDNLEITQDIISKVNNVAKHRGPDAENYFFKNNFAFGHRRLSIIDLSSVSDQPFSMFGFTIVYNGEIFNYIEIRQELLEKGYQFNTKSDTEVVLASYKEWGVECVDKFNGMWAFCIYDESQRKFFCSRDRFGIKPFYFIDNSQYFAFGSEVKQLLTLLPENKANKKVLAEFIVGNEDYHEETFFENVFKLLPGYNLEFNLLEKTIKKWKYYEVKKVEVPKDFDGCLKEYRSLFESSIELRLRSDVKVGTCLSGGLDSSAIASLASVKYFKQTNQKFLSIHAKSFEKETDESYYANLVAENAGLDMFTIEPDKFSFSDVLEKVIQIQGEPFGGPSIVMQYFVFEKASKQKITVMLDGQGGDETLIGYDSYFNMYLSTIPIVRSLIKYFKPNRKSLFIANLKFAFFLRKFNGIIKRKLHKKRFSFLKESYFNRIDHTLIFDEALNHCKNDFFFQKFEMEHGIQKLLRYEDRNSMYHGIESRLPFLDHRLVEYSLSLPLVFKLKDNETKHILREMMVGNVPDEVIYRKDKKGFEAPSSFWNQYITDSAKNIQESKIIKDMIVGDLPKNKALEWRLANIAAWEKAFNVTL
jgi:asparagine synthase (glutamine-hydrolysing)